ncbi:MAG: SEC-C metal-binding domain-containing protein [bacterium]
MTIQQIDQDIKDSIQSRWSNGSQPEVLLDQLKAVKSEYVHRDDQSGAKRAWCLEQVVLVHKHYIEAYRSLLDRQFYGSWCAFEKSEIRYGFVTDHLERQIDNPYLLDSTLAMIHKFQSLFPYKLFFSPEMLYLNTACTICGAERSIRNPCGHEIGEIYDGEMCGRRITEFRAVGVSVVTEPHQKYSVAFPSSPEDKERRDPYNYAQLEYLVARLQDPYDEWDVRLTTKSHSINKFKSLGRNDQCPCGSGIKFKKCCLPKGSIELPHYEFWIETIGDPKLAADELHYGAGGSSKSTQY